VFGVDELGAQANRNNKTPPPMNAKQIQVGDYMLLLLLLL
jgi:hypothetical protein